MKIVKTEPGSITVELSDLDVVNLHGALGVYLSNNCMGDNSTRANQLRKLYADMQPEARRIHQEYR